MCTYFVYYMSKTYKNENKDKIKNIQPVGIDILRMLLTMVKLTLHLSGGSNRFQHVYIKKQK